MLSNVIDGAALEQTLVPLGHARHAPGKLYTCPQVEMLEKQKIFTNDWLCVAREEEIEKPGDYMSFDLLNESFVVARDVAGKLNAFMNNCAHRGVAVAQGQGNARSFLCPFHGWNFGLDGRLIGAPLMKESPGFDPRTCRLKSLRIGTWAGWIFVNFDMDAVPLEKFVREFETDIGFLRQEDCRIAQKFTIHYNANWKLVLENMMDVYHIQTAHSGALRDNSPRSIDYERRSRGGMFGLYEGTGFTTDGKSLFPAMPWLADRTERFAATSMLSPNFTLLARRDFIRPAFIWPITPTACRLVLYHLFPKERFADAGFVDKAQTYVDWYRTIVPEDVPVVEATQKAAASDFFVGGTMSSVESAIHHFLSSHITRLQQ